MVKEKINSSRFDWIRIPEKRFEAIVLLIAVTLPFSIALNSFSIVLLVINWLTLFNPKFTVKAISGKPIPLLLICIYLLHLGSLLYSDNIQSAFFDLEKKFSFLVLPIVFFSSVSINMTFLKKVLWWFSWSCLTASIACIAFATYRLANGDSSYFFYHELGSLFDIHAGYFSVYVFTAIFVQLDYVVSKWNDLNTKRAIVFSVTILFLIGFLILLSSKTILLVLLIFPFLILFGKAIKPKLKILIVLSIPIIITSVIFLIPSIKQRFSDVLIDEYHQTNPLLIDDYSGYHFTGANIRLAIWKICVKIVNSEEAWIFGVGSGDSQDLLTKTYREKHIYGGDDLHEGFLHYNAHNQFFQFYVSTGIIGLTLFLALLYKLLIKAYKNRALVLFASFIVFSIFCLSESALERQKGIVYFSFLASLFARAASFGSSEKKTLERDFNSRLVKLIL